MLIDENTFIISDTHFGDTDSVANGFDKYITEKWNKAVSESDTVLHLGDFTSDDDMFNIERKIERYSTILNGRIVLIKGNHDTAWPFAYERNGIEFINDSIVDECGNVIETETPGASAVTGTFNGLKVLFSHYPIRDLYAIMHTPEKREGQDYYYIPESEIEDATGYLDNFFTWNKFDINIHGHIHEKTDHFKNLINVSIYNIGYMPVRIGEVLQKIGTGV